MITRWNSWVWGVAILGLPLMAAAVQPSEIPADTPIAALVSTAKQFLAQGNANDALTYFDAAIARDPQNYLTIFQRGATYLSLGNNGKATSDFDRALAIRPDFEGALLQRAKIKSRNAEWDGAREDYKTAGKVESDEYIQLEEAATSAQRAITAEKEGDWEACVTHSGLAILIASANLNLRRVRLSCRFERGEMLEAMSDLQHISQLTPSSIEPHMQISASLFYAANDREKATEQLKKCLRSDPDSRPCSKLLRREKNLNKALKELNRLKERRQLSGAIKLLIPQGEDVGLLEEIKQDVQDYKEAGYIHKTFPNDLYDSLIETTCELYLETNKKKASTHCTQALSQNEHSLHGLLYRAHTHTESEDYEAAIADLNLIKEHHASAHAKYQAPLQKAHLLLKRSKEKDYYKVIGVASDADDRAIKRAYRRMTKQHHPDKAAAKGIKLEAAQKKMAEINEAYEVLSDPELRARFDRGDDPNNPQQQQQQQYGGPFHGSHFGGAGQQYFRQQGQQFKQRQGGAGAGFGFNGF